MRYKHKVLIRNLLVVCMVLMILGIIGYSISDLNETKQGALDKPYEETKEETKEVAVPDKFKSLSCFLSATPGSVLSWPAMINLNFLSVNSSLSLSAVSSKMSYPFCTTARPTLIIITSLYEKPYLSLNFSRLLISVVNFSISIPSYRTFILSSDMPPFVVKKSLTS